MTSEPTYVRGQIVLVPVAFTDQSATKQRPVLLLTAPDAQGDHVAVPITSRPGHANAIPIPQDHMAAGVLPKPSWIKADKPFTLNRCLVQKRFGAVKPQILSAVGATLCPLVGCE